MPRALDRRHVLAHRPAVAAFLLVVVMLTGVAATAAAAPTLPACKVADTLSKHRWLTDWNRSLLDVTYRLSSEYAPKDLTSTRNAGLNSGYYVRSLVITDLKAMASAARAAGARFIVTSAYRSYTAQKNTFAYWVRVHGYAVRRSATGTRRAARLGRRVRRHGL